MFWRALPIALSAAYLLALVAWGASIWGWLGTQPDPLSAIGLVVLGMPWLLWADNLPEPTWPLATALSPLINITILHLLTRAARRWWSSHDIGP